MNNIRAPRCHARQVGFSLLELMVTVAIIGIVAAIAIPSYDQYVKKSRRADGMTELSRLMQRQEKYFINYLEYSTDFSDLGITGGGDEVESSAGYYLIKASACADSTITRCVILTGTPTGTQADDGWLSINSRGQRDWELNVVGETGWP